MRAVIYARVSNEEQGGNFSIPSQIAACRSYAAQRGMQVVAEISDTMSGALLDRPGLRQVRDLVQARAVDAVIVHALDRLSRNTAHLLLLRDEFKRAALHIVTRGQSQDTAEGRLFDTIEGAFAEYERLKIKERSQRGKRQKLASGRVIGQGKVPPFGYRYEGEKRDRRLVVYEPEAEHVRAIYRWVVDGMPTRSIAAKLDNLGVPPPGNNRHKSARVWYHQTVTGIIRNPVYRGEYVSKTYQASVAVPRIVDDDLWYAAQAALERNAALASRNAKRPYPLRSRLRCACGAPAHGEPANSRNRTYYYYRCAAHDREHAGSCPGRLVRADVIEPLIWQWVVATVLDEARLAQAITAACAEQQRHLQEWERERAAYQRQIDDASASIGKLVELYTAGVLSIDEVAEHKRRIEQARASAEAELARIEQRIAAAAQQQISRDDLLAMARQAQALLRDPASATPDVQQRIYAALDLRAVLDDDAVHVEVSLTGETATLAIASRSFLPLALRRPAAIRAWMG